MRLPTCCLPACIHPKRATRGQLSSGSRRTLAFQGGPMTAAEALAQAEADRASLLAQARAEQAHMQAAHAEALEAAFDDADSCALHDLEEQLAADGVPSMDDIRSWPSRASIKLDEATMMAAPPSARRAHSSRPVTGATDGALSTSSSVWLRRVSAAG